MYATPSNFQRHINGAFTAPYKWRAVRSVLSYLLLTNVYCYCIRGSEYMGVHGMTVLATGFCQFALSS